MLGYGISKFLKSYLLLIYFVTLALTGAKCDISNSNKLPGKACKCNQFYGGKIEWNEKGDTASGYCEGIFSFNFGKQHV